MVLLRLTALCLGARKGPEPSGFRDGLEELSRSFDPNPIRRALHESLDIWNSLMARIIAHLDMDAFFAAVEERDHPELHGAPIVVGAGPRAGRGRGVVSTANYKAREYGIHSAMPISRAWRASENATRQGKPAVVFLQVNMSRYKEVSAHIMAVLRRFVPLVQQAGVDEAYLDLTFIEGLP